MAVQHKHGLSRGEFEAGMHFAIKQGWFKPTPKQTFELTKAGFDKIGGNG
jgi:hypothetical protein